MRTSQYLLSTLKNTPYDAEIISHQLMLRSGMIRKISSGVYIWLPTGLRVLKKIQKIIRQEMHKIHALEISMPIMQPKSLWKKSGRLELYGKELLTFLDRRNKQFILSPTNEEAVTHFIKNEIHSYKNLPKIVYQIQTKFRDEIRPRFGIIRSREFIMKDAYSFHINEKCLHKTYFDFYNSYVEIFKKIHLDFRVVRADSGSMGGNVSHEFQAFSKNGEDEIVYEKNTLHAENIHFSQSIKEFYFFENMQQHKKNYNIEETKKSIIHINKITIKKEMHIKTILVKTEINKKNSLVAFLIRSDHELSMNKIEKIHLFNKPIVILNEKEIFSLKGVNAKFIGPIGWNIPIIADIETYTMKNFTIGSNINNHVLINVNWNIDLPIPIMRDIRKIGKKNIKLHTDNNVKIKKSIEIGHIFQLGQKYSSITQATIKEKNGATKNFYMGCYGIGITRIIAAIIEQKHDQYGIMWPDSIAPFHVIILPINFHNSPKIKKIANTLYQDFQKNNIDILLYDSQEQPGVMFHQADLIGIPHQIIISVHSIKNNNVEYRNRTNKKNTIINLKDIHNFIVQCINI